MAGNYDYDDLPDKEFDSLSAAVSSAISSTSYNKDVVYVHIVPHKTITRVTCCHSIPPLSINRFQQIILDLEE